MIESSGGETERELYQKEFDPEEEKRKIIAKIEEAVAAIPGNTEEEKELIADLERRRDEFLNVEAVEIPNISAEREKIFEKMDEVINRSKEIREKKEE